MASGDKKIVYIIRSDADPSRFYTGVTGDVVERMQWHKDGGCGVTTSGRPWSLVVALHFATQRAAYRFEKYLKSGSGRAFSKRHFSPDTEQ